MTIVTWPSSVALSLWLLKNNSNLLLLNNPSILEVGAGTGLVGLVTAKLFSDAAAKNDYRGGKVILSDYNPLVLDNLKRNIVLNRLEQYADTSCLDFNRQDGTHYEGGWMENIYPSSVHDTLNTQSHLRPREAVDMVLAADVICQPSDSVSLSKTIYDALKPGGKAIVSSAAAVHRFGVETFQSECEKRGMTVTVSSIVPEGNPSLYLSTSGFVEGMSMNLYEIGKPCLL